MRKKLQCCALFFILGMPLGAFSQSKSLSLEEALKLAEENNLNIKGAEAKEAFAKGSYRMTNSVLLPGLSVSHTGIATSDPLSAFGFKLKQEIVSQADFDPASLNNPNEIENYSTKIEVQQPLLNMDGIYARKAARDQYEATILKSKRVKENIRYEVKKAYFGLELAASAVEVLKQSVNVAQEAYQLTKNNEEQGFVKHADVLEAAVRLDERKNQLLEAQNQQQTANEYLLHLLGMDLNVQFETTDSLVPPPTQIYAQNISGDLKHRSDLEAIQKQVEAGENNLRSEKMKFVPRINAFGSYEWNDHKLLGTSANNYMVGAKVSWNLFSGYKNIGGIQRAKAQLEEAQYNYENYLSQSQIQLNRAKRKLDLNYQQIQSSKRAKEQAEESLRIRTNRFKQGLEKTTDLLMSEALSSKKELEYIQSIYNYKQVVFEMELLLEKEINK